VHLPIQTEGEGDHHGGHERDGDDRHGGLGILRYRRGDQRPGESRESEQARKHE
jgi:hypothetical protein